MFHDPALGRTTDSTGRIFNCRFIFSEALRDVPENHHVKFNVDVKVQNDPDRLFALMHDIISTQPNWETILAPRILLGLWHPRFLSFAKARLPYCRRSYIGNSPYIARKYFWNDCDAFSMSFASLTTADGEKFRKECKAAGKNLMVWTVNQPDHMMEAVRWEVNAIITDVTKTWLDLRAALNADYEKQSSQYGRSFLWTSLQFYTPFMLALGKMSQSSLEKIAGPFDDYLSPPAVVAGKA
ncbi:PLC-like phosphodiesterase [Cyathus striatus]|nr:PLC-like phosphodiesterase [Cyathus striatus]